MERKSLIISTDLFWKDKIAEPPSVLAKESLTCNDPVAHSRPHHAIVAQGRRPKYRTKNQRNTFERNVNPWGRLRDNVACGKPNIANVILGI